MGEPVVRWKLLATGKVQLVGYRARVAAEAEKRGLVGVVENDENDERRVFIEAQGPASVLEGFRQAIAVPEGRSAPKEVTRVQEFPVDPGLNEFRVIRGNLQLETIERMEQGNLVLGSMDESLGSIDRRLGSLEHLGQETLTVGKATLTVGKATLTVGKATLAVGKETLAETRRVGNAVEGVQREVHTGNLRLGKSLDRMHEDVSRRFDRVDASYGTIGKTLLRIDKNLEKLTQALLLLAKETHRANTGVRSPPSRSSRRKKGRGA